jgi:hypothetical protein
MSALLKVAIHMIVVGSVIAPVFAQNTTNREGPFGLTWGSTVEQTKAAGIKLKAEANKENGVSFIASNLPKALSDQDFAFVAYGFDDKLCRIVAVSRSFSNDPTGERIRARYEELLGVLAEKYGSARSSHSLGDSIYGKPEYFLSGIEQGKSNWFSDFDTPALSVQIAITASDSSTARWTIIFEDNELARSFSAARKSREMDSVGPSRKEQLSPESRALDDRKAALMVSIAPGSALSCLLDEQALEVVEGALGSAFIRANRDLWYRRCEQAVFASPESVASAVKYVSAQLSLLDDGTAYVARGDASYAAELAPLRTAIEFDRFGLVAHVLADREGCTLERCDALSRFRDSTRVLANLRNHTFDGLKGGLFRR